jgi:site-specific recombinase XerD
MMLEELQRRNYAQSTVKGYLRIVQEFAEYFHQPPDKLGPEHLRQYQAHLFQDKELNAGTVQQHVAALRFFFNKTLKRHYLLDDLPMPKRHRKLPEILSPDEVALLIGSASNLLHQTMLMTLYSTGMRRAELCRLKTTDIDSQRMMVHIRQGKGGHDRDVPLSPKLLQTLRIYWRWMKPKTYLFPGTVKNWRADVPITTKVPWEACREAAQRAGITKHVSPHTLRHASAYYTTFQSLFILKIIGLGRARSVAVYGHRGPLSPVAVQPAVISLSGRLSTEHTLPHASPVEYVLG